MFPSSMTFASGVSANEPMGRTSGHLGMVDLDVFSAVSGTSLSFLANKRTARA